MQKHHPFADFPKRSIRQILLHSPRHCLGMGLIFSQPSLRHHELQSGWRRPHEILHCIPIFLLRAVLIAGDYREFLQIDLLLRKPQPRYRPILYKTIAVLGHLGIDNIGNGVKFFTVNIENSSFIYASPLRNPSCRPPVPPRPLWACRCKSTPGTRQRCGVLSN